MLDQRIAEAEEQLAEAKEQLLDERQRQLHALRATSSATNTPTPTASTAKTVPTTSTAPNFLDTGGFVGGLQFGLPQLRPGPLREAEPALAGMPSSPTGEQNGVLVLDCRIKNGNLLLFLPFEDACRLLVYGVKVAEGDDFIPASQVHPDHFATAQEPGGGGGGGGGRGGLQRCLNRKKCVFCSGSHDTKGCNLSNAHHQTDAHPSWKCPNCLGISVISAANVPHLLSRESSGRPALNPSKTQPVPAHIQSSPARPAQSPRSIYNTEVKTGM
ncbi:hypothetical protein B0T14DRAFT_583797 [Immersiella caudata]|uniref:Uncharacterized protein n=1 Tax=Immersiella caudata TaxID=314043 RepID=A0AA40C447_9PEZI|nr:hypothetical protein B0T14DRAFT_583797 [Immersiella caudata]